MYGGRMEGNEDDNYAEGRQEILGQYADGLLLIWQGFGHVTKGGWGVKLPSLK